MWDYIVYGLAIWLSLFACGALVGLRRYWKATHF